jgi:EAL domain-containing protein (putative c-di-GMP-specific phosphodiesterase class I)
MKDLGVNLALDAFGKGNASLDYLTRFPFDMIKIDPSQILDTTERGAILLRSVIAMAKELGMTIVVEGIQSEQDAIKLGELGCDFGQSKLFSPPVGTDSVQRLLKERFPLTKG